MREKFWQWLADIFFYKVWLSIPRQNWGLYAYHACTDVKHKRISVRQGIKEVKALYKSRKEH